MYAALYELIPAGSDDLPRIDPLKYQQVQGKSGVQFNNELMTVKLRYKPLHQKKSRLLTTTVPSRNVSLAATSNDFRFAAAVAGFGMLLQDSDLRGDLDYNQVLTLAKNAKGTDDEGYRAEFIRLVEMSQLLQCLTLELLSKKTGRRRLRENFTAQCSPPLQAIGAYILRRNYRPQGRGYGLHGLRVPRSGRGASSHPDCSFSCLSREPVQHIPPALGVRLS